MTEEVKDIVWPSPEVAASAVTTGKILWIDGVVAVRIHHSVVELEWDVVAYFVR